MTPRKVRPVRCGKYRMSGCVVSRSVLDGSRLRGGVRVVQFRDERPGVDRDGFDAGSGERGTEQEALHQVGLDRLRQDLELLEGLDAFHGHLQAEAARKVYDTLE